MHDAHRLAVGDHHQRHDLGGVEHVERRGDQRVGRNRLGVGRHDILDAMLEDALGEMAAQIAVGDDADKVSPRIGDAEAAKAFLRDHQQRLVHPQSERRKRQPVAPMHHVADVGEVGAQRAAGMKAVEVVGGEAAVLQKGDGERIPERQLQQRRRGGRKPVRAGLLDTRQDQRRVGGLRQRRIGARGDRDERHAEPARVEHDVLELDGLARPGHGHHHVFRDDHAQIAVAGLGGMDEEGRGAGRRQRRRDLASDVAAQAASKAAPRSPSSACSSARRPAVSTRKVRKAAPSPERGRRWTDALVTGDAPRMSARL